MKLKTVILAGCVCALAVAGSAVAVTQAVRNTSRPPTISSGSPVSFDSFGRNDQALLTSLGADVQSTLIGALRGTAFYEFGARDGGVCWAFGSAVKGGLDVACSHGPSPLSQPLVDMSIVAFDPASGATGGIHLVSLQGVAADGVAAVGVVTSDGASRTTPAINNVYRMPDADIPSGAVTALVALDASGATVWADPIAS